MAGLPRLRISLVPPEGGQREAWPLGTLAEQLEAHGHSVETGNGPIDETSSDVVHCLGLSASDRIGASAPSTPLLVTPSAGDVRAAESATLAPPVAGRASAAVRSAGQQAQMHRLGVPWSRTWILPVAVDVATFTRRGSMANRTHRLRLVSELTGPHDGTEDVLVAMSKLDDVELVAVVGDDRASNDAGPGLREAQVKAAAAELGVAQRVAVVEAESPGQRAWWLRSAHVVVAVPSRPDGSEFGAEAMACGAPLLATPVDTLSDLVVHGVTGLHVPRQDPLSLARALRRLLRDDFARQSFGMAAADRALSRFAWPRVAHELVGVYRRVADGAMALDPAVGRV